MGHRPIMIVVARLLAVGTAACAGVAYADEPDPPPVETGPPPIEASPIVVEGQAERPSRDPLTAGEVLTPSQAGAQWSVGDLVSGIAGAQLRSAGGPGQRQTLSMRGADGQQLLVLLDDVPLGSAMGGGVDLALLPLAGLDRVEVYRGGSAMLGADAIGGALRLVPGEPPAIPVTRLRTGGGSFGTALVSAAHAGLYGDLGVSASASFLHSDGAFGFEDGNGAPRTRANNGSDVAGGSLRLVWRVSKDLELTVSDHAQGAARGVPGVDQFPTPAARATDALNVAQIVVRARDVGVDGLDLTVGGWHRYSLLRFEDPEPWLPPAIDNRHDMHGVGAHAELTWYWGEHQVVIGRIEGRGEWGAIARSGASAQSPSRGVLGLLVADEVTLADGIVRFTPAVRVDIATGFDPVAVPKLGVEVRPVDPLAFRVNVGRAYRLPSFEELYYDAGQVRGNPDLSPEDALSIDAGVELDLGWIRANATWFRLQIANLVVFLPKTAFLIEADDGKAALSQGVEAGLTVQPVEGLELGATYTFTDARFEDTGARLPGRSEHQVGGRVAGRVWRLGGWVGATWQSETPLDRFGSLVEEGRVMLGAGLDGEVTDWMTLEVEGTNLLDLRGAVDALQQPLPGLAVLGSVRVEL